MYRQTFRQDYRHFSGYRSTNYGANLKPNSSGNALVKIAPLAVGRLVSIRQKGESIFGSTFVLDQQLKTIVLNPLWSYLLFITIAYQKIFISINKSQTDFEQEFTRQIITDLRYMKLEVVAKQTLIERIDYVFNNLQSALERITKRETNLRSLGKVEKLQFFRKWVAEQAENVKPAVKIFFQKNIVQNSENVNYIQKLHLKQQYVEELLAGLQAIQPLKISQQALKFKAFEKMHKESFQASILIEKIRGSNYYFMKVGKLSQETEPVLQRLNEFVDLRFDAQVAQNQYKTETVNFIKDLYTQIQKYQNATEKVGFRSSYYYLSPQNVIIDQLSLMPKLHYEPALLQTFGLQRNAYSLESRLSFQPTPKGPNFFRSLEELDQTNMLKLKDPLYGTIELYQNEKQKMTTKQNQEIQNQKAELQKLKMMITVWRFLLVSYYINYGTEFGRKFSPISHMQVEKQFEKNLRKKKLALNKNASELSQFLGTENKRFQGVRFEWRLEQIGEYLQFQNDDSVIKSHKFERKLRYTRLRWSLLDQINSTLRNHKFLTNLMNVKRYILMYLLDANEIYEESRHLLEAEKKKTGQRKLLRKLFEQKEKKMDYFSDVKNTMDNINKYLSRNPEKDPQAKFLKASDRYIHILMVGILDQLIQINSITQTLNTIENKDENVPLADRNEYKNELLRLQQKIEAGHKKVHIITAEFVCLEIFLKSSDQLYRPTNQQTQRKLNKLQKKKVVLQFFTYLTLNQDNYFLYQSAVAPLLITYKTQNQNEQKPTDDGTKLEELKCKLQAVEQAINLKQIVPKQLQFLKGNDSITHGGNPKVQAKPKQGQNSQTKDSIVKNESSLKSKLLQQRQSANQWGWLL